MSAVQPHEIHNEQQRRYYGTRPLPRMDPRRRAASTYTQRHVDMVVKAINLRANDLICDVGCGPGKYTVALSDRGLNVEGLDLTPRLVGELQAERGGSIPAHLGDLCDPPQELHGRFSAVVGFMMLHHVDDLSAAFRGIHALLVPGGRATFLEPNPLFPGYYVQIACTPGMTWRHERGIVNIRPKVITSAARAAGFGPVRSDTFGVFPPFVVNRHSGRRVEEVLEAIPGWSRGKAFQLFSMSRVE